MEKKESVLGWERRAREREREEEREKERERERERGIQRERIIIEQDKQEDERVRELCGEKYTKEKEIRRRFSEYCSLLN